MELDPQESPGETKSREVELDPQESPGETKGGGAGQESPGETNSKEVELDPQENPGETKSKEVEPGSHRELDYLLLQVSTVTFRTLSL